MFVGFLLVQETRTRRGILVSPVVLLVYLSNSLAYYCDQNIDRDFEAINVTLCGVVFLFRNYSSFFFILFNIN